jgi:TetR/AcrR family transcriptional repressor of nem operon
MAERLMNAFWATGFARTSIPDLVKATGLLRGSLYATFKDKDAMFEQALNRYLDQLRTDIISEATGIEGIAEMLQAVVEITLADPERRGCLLINAIPEVPDLDDANRAAINKGLEEMKAFVRFKLEEEPDERKVAPDLERLTALVFAASVSIRVLGRARQDRKLLQDVADGAVDALNQAFKKTP